MSQCMQDAWLSGELLDYYHDYVQCCLIKGQTQESPSVPITAGSKPVRIRDFFPGVKEAGDTSLQNFV